MSSSLSAAILLTLEWCKRRGGRQEIRCARFISQACPRGCGDTAECVEPIVLERSVIPVLVLNLSSDAERGAWMTAHLQSFGIPRTIVPAIDGNTITSDDALTERPGGEPT